MPLIDLNLTDTNTEHAQTEPGMAYFAGTGPVGETCGKCRFWGYRKVTKGGNVAPHDGCNKFFMLTGKDGPAIKAALLACKYFEKRETATPPAPPPLTPPYRDHLDEPPSNAGDYHD